MAFHSCGRLAACAAVAMSNTITTESRMAIRILSGFKDPARAKSTTPPRAIGQKSCDDWMEKERLNGVFLKVDRRAPQTPGLAVVTQQIVTSVLVRHDRMRRGDTHFATTEWTRRTGPALSF